MGKAKRLRWSDPIGTKSNDPLQSSLKSPPENLRAFRHGESALEAGEDELLTLPDLAGFDTPKQKAVYLLQIAAEVEHALLVQYLYAGNSVVDGELKSTLLSVAIEEMGHLATVQNILIAMGELPYLYRQDFGTPTQDDLRLFPFELQLEPITEKSLAKYIYVESPEMPELPSVDLEVFQKIDDLARAGTGPDPNRVGRLYYLIAAIFGTKELLEERAKDHPEKEWYERVNWIADHAREKYGENNVHLPDGAISAFKLHSQATDQVWDRVDLDDNPDLDSDVKVHPITGDDPSKIRDEVLDSLSEIGIQGEGLGASMGGVGEFEKSHFYLFFSQFKKTFHAGSPPSVLKVPTGAVIPIGSVDENAITNDEAVEWANLGNLRYHLLIGFLEQYFRTQASSADSNRLFLAAWCFAEMYNLKKIAGFLSALPRANGGDVSDPNTPRASLPYSMPPDLGDADELSFAFDNADGKWPQIHASRFEISLAIIDDLMQRDLSADKERFLDYCKESDTRKFAEAKERQNGATQRTKFDVIKEILDWAIGTGDPRHPENSDADAPLHGRFWNLPLNDLKQIKVWARKIITENDGSASELIRVLKGGFQMPLGRKKLTDLGDFGNSLINQIEKWIDEGATDDPV